METRFGHQFSEVRVHDDPAANASARALGADAFTVGRDVVFSGRMQGFHTSSERGLLAHELVHVVQSDGTRAGATARPHPGSSATDGAEREADLLSRDTEYGASSPTEHVTPGTLLRRVQATTRDFHDPNFCYHPGTSRDSTHPDMTKVVAVMQAEIETPESCDGQIVLRTSVLKSSWGAASAEFESYGGGTSQGIQQGLHRDTAAERVDYEERFVLDSCHSTFSRCHLIKYTEGNTTFTFADAGYQTQIFATSEPSGPVLHDSTPPPNLVVNPCNHVSPSLCSGSGASTSSSGATGTSTATSTGAAPGTATVTPSTEP